MKQGTKHRHLSPPRRPDGPWRWSMRGSRAPHPHPAGEGVRERPATTATPLQCRPTTLPPVVAGAYRPPVLACHRTPAARSRTPGVRRGRQRERGTSGRCLPSPAPPCWARSGTDARLETWPLFLCLPPAATPHDVGCPGCPPHCVRYRGCTGHCLCTATPGSIGPTVGPPSSSRDQSAGRGRRRPTPPSRVGAPPATVSLMRLLGGMMLGRDEVCAPVFIPQFQRAVSALRPQLHGGLLCARWTRESEPRQLF